MPSGWSVQVTGGEELRRLARDIKAAGDKNLRRELNAGFRRLTKPVKAAAKEGAAKTLPHRGGLAARVAGGSYRTSVRSSRSGASLKLVVSQKSGRGRMNLSGMDAGRVRHPVYGSRTAWVEQSIKPHWFTDSTKKSAKAARKEAVKVVREVAGKLARGG